MVLILHLKIVFILMNQIKLFTDKLNYKIKINFSIKNDILKC